MLMMMYVWTVDRKQLDINPLTNSVEFIWSTTTVAVGDTAVLHCSFDAIFQQLRSGNVRFSRACVTFWSQNAALVVVVVVVVVVISSL